MLAFRGWLRTNEIDRGLYAGWKQARREWKYSQNYADAKAPGIKEIMSRIRASGRPHGVWIEGSPPHDTEVDARTSCVGPDCGEDDDHRGVHCKA